MVELRQTHRAHQRRIGFGGQPNGFIGQRASGLMNRDAAQQTLGQLQGVIRLAHHAAEDLDGLTRDFSADPISGQN